MAIMGDCLVALTLENQCMNNPSFAMEYSSRGKGNRAPNKLEKEVIVYYGRVVQKPFGARSKVEVMPSFCLFFFFLSFLFNNSKP